jgi:hypothetical protein
VRRRRVGLALLLAVAPLTGCGFSNLQFRTDHRLDFLSPDDRAKVTQPVTISWRMDDFRIAELGSEPPTRDAGYFAIFVDRSPVKPGKTLRDVVGGDDYCRQNPKCTSRAELRQYRVFTTTDTSFRFPRLPDLLSNDESVQLHTFTVVLMDTAGHRIGESAWRLELRIPREAQV